jgi:hypothetical protein
VTRYRLDGPGIESLWGARISAAVQTDPEYHRASCTMSTACLSRGLSGRSLALTTPHPHLAPKLKKKRIPVPLLPLWAGMASSGLNFTLGTNLHSPGLHKVVQGRSCFHMTAARACVRIVNQHHPYWKKNPTYVHSPP